MDRSKVLLLGIGTILLIAFFVFLMSYLRTDSEAESELLIHQVLTATVSPVASVSAFGAPSPVPSATPTVSGKGEAPQMFPVCHQTLETETHPLPLSEGDTIRARTSSSQDPTREPRCTSGMYVTRLYIRVGDQIVQSSQPTPGFTTDWIELEVPGGNFQICAVTSLSGDSGWESIPAICLPMTSQ